MKRNKKEKDNIQDQYAILPDEELKARFKHDRKIQWLIALPMLVLLYCCIVLLPTVIDGGVSEGTIAISSVIALIGYSFVFAENPDNQKKAVKVDVTVLAVLVLPYIIVGSYRWILAQASYIIAVIAPNVIVHPFIKDIAVLKAHPRYPFDNWRRDDSYIHRASGDEVLKIIDNTINKGKVQSVGKEDFLEGEVKTFEPPVHDHEQDFQQREQVYRQHEKSDTGYTMDNLKNMYLGKSEEGELSGKELERELMKATAPTKPPEPIPEEFFQSSPVVWRTNKDGTTTMERRSPGSQPAGETDSRSVLP